MKTVKQNKKANTALEKEVQGIVNEHAADYDDGWRGYLMDLAHGGCCSGMVGELIYFADTCAFFSLHKNEINKLLYDALSDAGCTPAELFGDKWDKEDPLALEDANQNLLAWFGFEQTAFDLGRRVGIEL